MDSRDIKAGWHDSWDYGECPVDSGHRRFRRVWMARFEEEVTVCPADVDLRAEQLGLSEGDEGVYRDEQGLWVSKPAGELRIHRRKKLGERHALVLVVCDECGAVVKRVEDGPNRVLGQEFLEKGLSSNE